MRSRLGRLVRRDERGTAALELVCALPFLLSSLLVGCQLVAITAVGAQAQDAARAAALGLTRDKAPEQSALPALPSGLRGEATVEAVDDDGLVTVTVTVSVPALAGWLPEQLAEVSRSATGVPA